MTSRITLQALAENLIRESRSPFSAEEYLARLQDRWRRRIAPATLDRLKQNLAGHSWLIGTGGGEFLPYPAVLERVGHLPLLISLTRMELNQKVLVPGHRLIPFLAEGLRDQDLTFLDPEGRELTRGHRTFYIDEILSHYEYSGESQFPDRFRFNERMPGKSTLQIPVWDLTPVFAQSRLRSGDGLSLHLIDHAAGRFQIRPYGQQTLCRDRLRRRAFHLALEAELKRQWQEDNSGHGLEKQLLQAMFVLCRNPGQAPGFSLPDFVESLETLSIFRGGPQGPYLGPMEDADAGQAAWEETSRVPQGRTGTLNEIFKDMGLAFSEAEFQAILLVIMGEDHYNVEAVFNLLFGGNKDRFHSKRQHNAFYRMLRSLLNGVCTDLKRGEPRLITKLRQGTAGVKLRLIEILRFLEGQEVCLQDLPGEVLDQVSDLDAFCVEALSRLALRAQPLDIPSIRDIQLGLQVSGPLLERLEEDVYCRLGFY